MKNLQMEFYAQFRDWLTANPPCEQEVKDIIDETVMMRDLFNMPPHNGWPTMKRITIAVRTAIYDWRTA